jgi:hypothetical protein
MQLGSGVKKAKIYEQINLQWVAPHKNAFSSNGFQISLSKNN